MKLVRYALSRRFMQNSQILLEFEQSIIEADLKKTAEYESFLISLICFLYICYRNGEDKVMKRDRTCLSVHF